MNILITGIHGFVGSNLVAALKEQYTIFGLDIISPEKEGVQKTFAWNELDQIPPVELVIHLAGKAHDTKNTASAQSYFDINVGLTRKIFDWFLTTEAKKFIFFSSVKAVADQVKGSELIEEDLPDPQTPYGQSKLEAEEYIQSPKSEVRRRKSEDGSPKTEVRSPKSEGRNPKLEDESSQYPSLDLEPGTWNLEGRSSQSPNLEPQPRTPNSELRTIYILRPCMIHGPGNKGNLNALYKLVQKGFPWPLGAYENKRSFTSIDNVSYIIGQIIERDIEPGIYHVADDETLSTNELFRLIAQSQNRKSRIWNISGKLISLLARIGDVLHLPLNSERLQKLTESYVVSNQKIKKALGIEKMPVSARDGLKKTLESFMG